jgi:membrane-associated protein
MDLKSIIDFLLHLNVHLATLVENYGLWVYLLLFLTVFCETGLVITPFLPGDSLLFAVGALCGTGALDLLTSIVLLLAAAILGDSVNYWIGFWIGPKIFRRPKSRWFNPDHLRRAHEFCERHGDIAIVLARFAPIIRTYVPFAAGIGRMTYFRFMIYNVLGGVAWVLGFVLMGYFFGSWPVVQRHFSLIILGIVVLSVIPILIQLWRTRLAP